MRREGTAQFLDVRRPGPENVFVAVHEPYTEAPKVKAARLVPLTTGSDMAVAVAVELADRTDLLLSQLDDDRRLTCSGLDFTGHFAYAVQAGGEYTQAYMVDGHWLQAGEMSIESDRAHGGTIVGTLSTDRGDEINAFVTTAGVPTDSRLRGRLLLTEDGDGSTRGFFIETIRRGPNDTSIIQIDRLPGMTVEEGYVKLQYFPNWGISGELRFTIPSNCSWSAE